MLYASHAHKQLTTTVSLPLLILLCAYYVCIMVLCGGFFADYSLGRTTMYVHSASLHRSGSSINVLYVSLATNICYAVVVLEAWQDDVSTLCPARRTSKLYAPVFYLQMWALFIHFLGDVFTSLLLMGVGIIYYFLGHQHNQKWW